MKYRFPWSSHGVLYARPCSREIAAAFLKDPESQVDTSCAAEKTPKFFLPVK
jgi:hypothetical protein